MHRKVAAALVAAFALGIAGCGGSEATLTRAQLVRRIEVACRQAQETQEKQLRAVRGSSGGDAGQFLDAVVAGQKVAIERIGDLNAEDAMKDELDAFKQGMEDRIDLFEGIDTSGAAATVQRAIRAASEEGEAITHRLTDAATRLGVEGCV